MPVPNYPDPPLDLDEPRNQGLRRPRPPSPLDLLVPSPYRPLFVEAAYFAQSLLRLSTFRAANALDIRSVVSRTFRLATEALTPPLYTLDDVLPPPAPPAGLPPAPPHPFGRGGPPRPPPPSASVPAAGPYASSSGSLSVFPSLRPALRRPASSAGLQSRSGSRERLRRFNEDGSEDLVERRRRRVKEEDDEKEEDGEDEPPGPVETLPFPFVLSRHDPAPVVFLPFSFDSRFPPLFRWYPSERRTPLVSYQFSRLNRSGSVPPASRHLFDICRNLDVPFDSIAHRISLGATSASIFQYLAHSFLFTYLSLAFYCNMVPDDYGIPPILPFRFTAITSRNLLLLSAQLRRFRHHLAGGPSVLFRLYTLDFDFYHRIPLPLFFETPHPLPPFPTPLSFSERAFPNLYSFPPSFSRSFTSLTLYMFPPSPYVYTTGSSVGYQSIPTGAAAYSKRVNVASLLTTSIPSYSGTRRRLYFSSDPSVSSL